MPSIARRASSSYRHTRTCSNSPFKSHIPTNSHTFLTRKVSGEKRPRPSSMHDQAVKMTGHSQARAKAGKDIRRNRSFDHSFRSLHSPVNSGAAPSCISTSNNTSPPSIPKTSPIEDSGSPSQRISDEFCDRRALVGSFLFLGRVMHRRRVQHLEFMEYNMLKTIYFDFGSWPVVL